MLAASTYCKDTKKKIDGKVNETSGKLTSVSESRKSVTRSSFSTKDSDSFSTVKRSNTSSFDSNRSVSSSNSGLSSRILETPHSQEKKVVTHGLFSRLKRNDKPCKTSSSSGASRLDIPVAIGIPLPDNLSDSKSSQPSLLDQAAKVIEGHIKASENKKTQTEALVGRLQISLQSRIESNNQTGALLASKQLKMTENELDYFSQMVEELIHLFFEINCDEEALEGYEDSLDVIL